MLRLSRLLKGVHRSPTRISSNGLDKLIAYKHESCIEIPQTFFASEQAARTLCVSSVRSLPQSMLKPKPKVSKKEKKKMDLVIFDKDGTLICFQSMWVPWAKKLAEKLSKVTGLPLEKKVYDMLGYCTMQNKVVPGLLAESTGPIIKQELIKLLVAEGISEDKARKLVIENVEHGNHKNPSTLRSLADLQILFKILKQRSIKVAICTADCRKPTEELLNELDLAKDVDLIVCGDDDFSQPKPSPHNALMICDKLGVPPSEAVMVGDTKVDVMMGKAAKLGLSVGVLSGVGGKMDLQSDADHLIKNVQDLLPLIMPSDEWKDCYVYSADKRVLIEKHQGEEPTTNHDDLLVQKVNLVVFDLHGTLLCPKSSWVKWAQEIAAKLEELSHLNLTEKVFALLGVCQVSFTIQHGLLTARPKIDVKEALRVLLRDEGLGYEESLVISNQAWKDCKESLYGDLKVLGDIQSLFENLKQNNVKIAITSQDCREELFKIFNRYSLMKYVDMMVCGDDTHKEFNSIKLICDELKVDPADTIVISDSPSKLNGGKEAHVQASIGVLSGVGSIDDLAPHADHIVSTAWDIFDNAANLQTEQNKTPKKDLMLKTGLLNVNLRRRPPFSGTQSARYFSSVTPGEGTPEFTHIIVGAGSAGCVLINRLTEDPENKVLLIEAGPKDYTWKIHMPAALMYNLCDDKYNWYYTTEPEKCMDDRRMYWPRGRVWGGSSSLNAMVYIRGHAYDYDRWEREGAAGWSYADCLPYFRKSQTHELGADEYRGGDGPLHVSRGRTNNELFHAFIEASQQAGYPFTDDMNGYQQEGVGWMDMTIHKGKRWSTASAYLRPVLKRPNLETRVRAFVKRVLFEGNTAVGIEYEQKGTVHQVRATNEVILSGGAINSPQLLMLSGVGNADDLKKLDIPIVAHLPGVGQNLQDHLEIYIQQKCTKPVTLYSTQFPHNMIKIGLQWFLTFTGDGATAHLESGGFVRSNPGVEHPDIQFHFLPSTVNDHGREFGPCHAYQVHVGPMRPTSKGYLKLKTRNHKDHPLIVANYLSTEKDITEMREGIKISREIFAQKAFDPYRGEELGPGSHIQSDKDLDAFARQKADSAYHPSCTCKMGQPSDPMAVVDSETKVIGVENLRVVDASIMPSVVSGNLNGPTCMLAEKAADIIRGRQSLPKSNAPVWQPDTLEMTRRMASA